MHGWIKIQKYTNSKGKYLNKAFYKSINLNNRIIPIRIIKYFIIKYFIIKYFIIKYFIIKIIQKNIFTKITKNYKK